MTKTVAIDMPRSCGRSIRRCGSAGSRAPVLRCQAESPFGSLISTGVVMALASFMQGVVAPSLCVQGQAAGARTATTCNVGRGKRPLSAGEALYCAGNSLRNARRCPYIWARSRLGPVLRRNDRYHYITGQDIRLICKTLGSSSILVPPLSSDSHLLVGSCSVYTTRDVCPPPCVGLCLVERPRVVCRGPQRGRPRAEARLLLLLL